MSYLHRGVLIILDGLGDRPAQELEGLTPLEAARTPNLDLLVRTGQCGQVDPLTPGLPVGTQIGAGLLLGFPPRQVAHLARGPVEAAGVGLELVPGDVALRCNFATVRAEGERLVLVDRRAGRIREGTQELTAAVDGMKLGDGVRAQILPGSQHRAVLKLTGEGLSAAVADTDPGYLEEGSCVLESTARKGKQSKAVRTAEALNRFVREAHGLLQGHPVNLARIERGELPANALITRSAGMVRQHNSLVKSLGVRAAVVAAEHTLLGLGALFGFTVVRDPRFTAMPDTDLEAKLEATIDALESHDLVFLHVKAPDICAHDRDPVGKREFLERFDASLAPLVARDVVVGVTADHSSDCATGRHTGDPVPSLLYRPGGRRDACGEYGERACTQGGLGRITAREFLTSTLDAIGAISNLRAHQAKLFGLA